MNPSQHRRRYRNSNPLGRRAAHGMGLILASVLAMGPSTASAQKPQVRESVKPKVTIPDAVVTRRNRPARRKTHATSEDVVLKKRRRKRPRRERPGQRVEQVGQGDDARIHLRLSGSFELNLGNGRFIRGEGRTTIELDQAAAKMLRLGLGQKLLDAAPAGKDLLKAVGAMPETLKSTSEILKSLSNPDTQRALRQVEQLMQLLPQSPDKPESGG